ncbi:hypothetical protein DPMN_106144 [Dreissena polymorpha]|uniref:Uncharacterized protein n=1 Tax=Dreissena polymorpha TaxID=45954 RepID=A0A9D4K4G1_DREPO|nr:hypothetical protein DPMN_106144 [Dreissena polymorpha]
MAEQQVQTCKEKSAQISVENIHEHVVNEQNDVLSLDLDSAEEFSGFESDDIPRNRSMSTWSMNKMMCLVFIRTRLKNFRILNPMTFLEIDQRRRIMARHLSLLLKK